MQLFQRWQVWTSYSSQLELILTNWDKESASCHSWSITRSLPRSISARLNSPQTITFWSICVKDVCHWMWLTFPSTLSSIWLRTWHKLCKTHPWYRLRRRTDSRKWNCNTLLRQCLARLRHCSAMLSVKIQEFLKLNSSSISNLGLMFALRTVFKSPTVGSKPWSQAWSNWSLYVSSPPKLYSHMAELT